MNDLAERVKELAGITPDEADAGRIAAEPRYAL